MDDRTRMNDTNNGPQAIVILIDNSDRSIDGDFYPNRLDAQKNTAEHLMKFFTRLSPETQVSIGALSENNGVSASLTTNREKLRRSIAKIEPSGQIKLFQGINWAFLALHHRDIETIKRQRIIVFVGSKHDLTASSANILANKANKEHVAIDVIAFGEDVQDIDILSGFVQQIKEESHFLKADNDVDLLNAVLQSPIGHKTTALQNEIDEDPDLYYTSEMSYQENMQKAIEESLRENNNDNNDDDNNNAHSFAMSQEEQDIQAAIQESLKSVEEQRKKKEKKQKLIEEEKKRKEEDKRRKEEEKRKREEKKMEARDGSEEEDDDDDDIDDDDEEEDDDSSDGFNDPDLLEAIKLSKQDQNNSSDDDDNNDEKND